MDKVGKGVERVKRVGRCWKDLEAFWKSVGDVLKRASNVLESIQWGWKKVVQGLEKLSKTFDGCLEKGWKWFGKLLERFLKVWNGLEGVGSVGRGWRVGSRWGALDGVWRGWSCWKVFDRDGKSFARFLKELEMVKRGWKRV